MALRNEANAQEVSPCPLRGREPQQAVLGADEELVCPEHKRMFAQYRTAETGSTELILYYGDNEISFDEPDLFAFGEGLAAHPRFVASEATTWGRSYEWPRIRLLLEQLIAERVLRRAADDESDSAVTRALNRTSLLPPASSTVPRTWLDCEAITREVAGRGVELGYLELILPPYRLAHAIIDTEGRQVGEANVFPKELRLDVPTDWRSCPHAGSRYQDALPMNVAALKSMRVHWKSMMVGLLRVREAYLCRFPRARSEWTIGDLYCLSALVLTIPSYLTMRTRHRVRNGDLHPVLSSMYRVTDGVRMVMHHMMFSANIEPTLPMDTCMTSADLLAYAERNRIFYSSHGVCAGPPAMIKEFLRVLVQGQPIGDAQSVVLEAPVRAALDDIDPVFDYMFYGLQAYAVWSSRWPPMVRAYEDIFTIIEAWSGPTTDTFRAFRQRLGRSVAYLRNATRHNTEDRREKRERVYADMFARAVHALRASGCAALFNEQPLAQCIAPVAAGNDVQARDRLHAELAQRLCGTDPAFHSAELDQLADVLMGYFRQEQAILRAGYAIQQRINQLLGRTPPTRVLTGSDLAVHHRLQGTVYPPEVLANVHGRLPYIVDELDEELGLRVVVSGERIELS